METVNVEMQVPKEMKDVVDLLDGILEKVLSKASLASYTDLIGKLTAAADGVTGIGEELKSQYRDEAAAYLVQKMMSRLLPASEVAAE